MKFRLSSKYGALEDIREAPHTGIDLAMPEGTELRSLFDGVVEKVYDGNGNIGNGIKITSDDGTSTIFGHMKEVVINVGDKVKAGEFIGLSGNTGNSTGPHLHFGMLKDGAFIDPSEFAEPLSLISGDSNGVTFMSNILTLKTPLGDSMMSNIREKIQEESSNYIIDIASGVLSGLGEILVDMIGAIALIGGGILILLKVAGYDNGYKYAGILFTANVLIKYLFGVRI